jgi:hypothetical protein
LTSDSNFRKKRLFGWIRNASKISGSPGAGKMVSSSFILSSMVKKVRALPRKSMLAKVTISWRQREGRKHLLTGLKKLKNPPTFLFHFVWVSFTPFSQSNNPVLAGKYRHVKAFDPATCQKPLRGAMQDRFHCRKLNGA